MDTSKQVNKDGLTEEQFLAAYNPNKYEKPAVTVDMVIFTIMDEKKENDGKPAGKTLKLLMVKRGNHPFIGQWALPGGFVNMNENLDEAAARELKEETSVDHIFMEQLYTWGDVGRDPRMRVISTSYLSLVDSKELHIKADDDADNAKWFTVTMKLCQDKNMKTEKGYMLEKTYKLSLMNEETTLSAVVKIVKIVEGMNSRVSREIIESEGIAFDHAKIIQCAIERLRGMAENADITLNLIPGAVSAF